MFSQFQEVHKEEHPVRSKVSSFPFNETLAINQTNMFEGKCYLARIF
jgi:hypothetical protein